MQQEKSIKKIKLEDTQMQTEEDFMEMKDLVSDVTEILEKHSVALNNKKAQYKGGLVLEPKKGN